MSTSRYHLTLTTGLALGLGALVTWSISPHDAAGYPATSAISTGSNPVLAHGGRLSYSGDEQTVFTAPADQDIVVTDVVLSGANTTYDCRGQSRVTLTTPSGGTLASFAVDQRAQVYTQTGIITAHYGSGLPVSAGESLTIHTDSGFASCPTSYHYVDYSISGYLAQP